jgi:hypothetical protein
LLPPPPLLLLLLLLVGRSGHCTPASLYDSHCGGLVGVNSASNIIHMLTCAAVAAAAAGNCRALHQPLCMIVSVEVWWV